jgi:leucyl aminopeptidase (aminopeptidase T)
MRDEEYRKLRRALEEQREADLELIRAGYRAKLHALDMLWERPAAPDERALPAAPETQPRAEARKPAETQSPAATESTVIVVNSVQEEVEKALPRLPDVFDKLDIVRTLGWEPHRATLHRALATLQAEKKIAVQSRSRGRHPARYRKIGSSPREE